MAHSLQCLCAASLHGTAGSYWHASHAI
jgi:hypothetical protein